VLRKIFGPKKDLGTGDWKKLHDDYLHDLCSSANITRFIKSRIIRFGGACGTYGGEEMFILGICGYTRR
jgi:hypothetical protein